MTTSAKGKMKGGYLLIASGYLVESEHVLLVHHRGFDKWVPPGGHVIPTETFAEGVAREFAEETSIEVRVISAGHSIHPADRNATPEPVPFYVDVEREGFSRPALVQFFFVERVAPTLAQPKPEIEEVFACDWFGLEDLPSLETFDQVRSVAAYALTHHPRTSPDSQT